LATQILHRSSVLELRQSESEVIVQHRVLHNNTLMQNLVILGAGAFYKETVDVGFQRKYLLKLSCRLKKG